jgi:hypothetical protein
VNTLIRNNNKNNKTVKKPKEKQTYHSNTLIFYFIKNIKTAQWRLSHKKNEIVLVAETARGTGEVSVCCLAGTAGIACELNSVEAGEVSVCCLAGTIGIACEFDPVESDEATIAAEWS